MIFCPENVGMTFLNCHQFYGICLFGTVRQRTYGGINA